MGRRARGAPRVPRLIGVAVLERGRPGPRLQDTPGDCPEGLVLYSAKNKICKLFIIIILIIIKLYLSGMNE